MNKGKPKRSIILLSGGLDSAVNLAEATNRTEPAYCLTFDYGQKAAPREVVAARALSRHYGVPHRVIDLGWYAEIVPGPLSAVPRVPAAANARDADVWVPNRNGVFVAIGAAFAEAAGAELVIAGFNADEAASFPDNSRAFMDAANRALALSTLSGVEVVSFTADATKSEVVKLALELEVPLQYTYSCYEGRELMCGVCPSCRRNVAALAAAGALGTYGGLFESTAGGGP